jgi:broad specificity phosphatase PhoE
VTIAYYLSHPQVQVDPAVPVPEWHLSDAGRERLATLAGAGWLASVRRIVSSEERKAIETAEVLAPMTDGAQVEILSGFHENDRSATGFLPPAEFEAMADAFFAAPDRSVRGWEPAADAQARIVGVVDAALADGDAPVLFVGHGGVGTLLKCHVKGEAIARSADQAAEGGHPGGGNVHAFSIAERRHLFGWTALEQVAS